MEEKYYVYVYLDQRKSGKYIYKDIVLNYEPFYVGKGSGDREVAHLMPSALKEDSLKNRKIKKILKEVGELPLHHRIYQKLNEEAAKKIEKDMIAHFGRISLKTGCLCNILEGGDDHDRGDSRRIPIYEYDKNGNFIRKWDAVTDNPNYYNINRAIRDRILCGGSMWFKNFKGKKIPPHEQLNPNKKTKIINIQQVEPKTDTVLNEFKTIRCASKWIIEKNISFANLNSVRSKIIGCIRNKPGYLTAFNFKWKAKEKLI